MCNNVGSIEGALSNSMSILLHVKTGSISPFSTWLNRTLQVPPPSQEQKVDEPKGKVSVEARLYSGKQRDFVSLRASTSGNVGIGIGRCHHLFNWEQCLLDVSLTPRIGLSYNWHSQTFQPFAGVALGI